MYDLASTPGAGDAPGGDWRQRALDILGGRPLTRDEALAALAVPDERILDLMQAALVPREAWFGREVRVHMLENAKEGACPEDCSFCSQSARFDTGVGRGNLEPVDRIVSAALAAEREGAVTFCTSTATRSPSARDLDTLCEAVRRIKERTSLRVCVSLGLLDEQRANRLAEAGVDRYNHNLETSRRYFPTIVSTHSWEDRVDTIRLAKAHGLEACCGGILGLGETDEDRVDLAFALRELDVDSIPVNFLDPRPGTPLQAHQRMRPLECLKALAMFRLVHPDKDVRISGGREVNLRSMQPLALSAATSLFSAGYLTTGGQGFDADRQMIEDAGFHVARLRPTGDTEDNDDP